MKLLPLALAFGVIAASGSASAATIYKKDGFTFKIDGDIQLQLRQEVDEDSNSEIDIDDSELKPKVSYDIGGGYKAYAEAHFDVGNDDDGNVEAEETFIGIKNKIFKVQIGRQDYVTDDFATERAIEEPFAESAFEEDNDNRFDNDGFVDGDDVILASIRAGAFDIHLSQDIGGADEDDFSSSDIYVTANINKYFQVGVAAQILEEEGGLESDTYGINFHAKLGPVSLAGDYSEKEYDDSGVEDTEVFNLSAGFKLAKTTKAVLGYTNIDNGSFGDLDVYYANVTYKFPKAKNVSVFAEIQGVSEDVTSTSFDEDDTGYLVGMRIKF